MKCPSCQSQMNQKKYEGVAIDLCPSCGGTWLDWNEIGQIVTTREERFSEAQMSTALKTKGQDHRSGKEVTCPKCQKKMETFEYAVNSGVILDRCPSNHGIWLDKGELEKVQIVMDEYATRRGEGLGKEEAKEGAGEKRCPRDGTKLKEIKYETETVDICPSCGGSWCDDSELRAIVESHEKNLADAHAEIKADEKEAVVSVEFDLVSSLDCVVCKKQMQRLNYSYSSGIIIDRCRDGHGVWLDNEELERVQVFVERWKKREKKAVSKYATALKNAGQEAGLAYEKAVKEGRKNALSGTVIGKFINGLFQ